MLRKLNPLFPFVCLALSGCMTVDSVADWTGRHSPDSSDQRELTRDFNLNDAAERHEALASLDREMIRDQVAGAPRGSQVSVDVDFDQRFMGTVVSAEPEAVELMNCICREVVPGPNGQSQIKTSHVPFQSLKTSSMTRFMVIAPPPSDFASTDRGIDGSEVTVAEIVYRNGRRQRWGKPPEPDESDQETNGEQ